MATWLKETASAENRETEKETDREASVLPKEVDTEKELPSKELADKAYAETIRGIVNENSDCIPEDQKTRIRITGMLYKPTLMSQEAYCERFPESDPNTLGHYNTEGRIYIKDGDPETLCHVATHEAIHLSSFHEIDDHKPENQVCRCGIRETTYDENRIMEDRNCALNEGITELFAVEEMQRRGEIKEMLSVSSYPEAQKAAFELRELTGRDAVREAYFGGETEQLKEKVIRMSYGDETAWERFSKNVDVLEYGTDEAEILKARHELTRQKAIMLSFKEEQLRDAHDIGHV